MIVTRFNLLVLLLVAVFIFLQYRLWFEPSGLRDMMKLKKSVVILQNENDELKKQNDDLVFQIQRLRNGKDATEARARNELGMVKKDETFYQIVK